MFLRLEFADKIGVVDEEKMADEVSFGQEYNLKGKHTVFRRIELTKEEPKAHFKPLIATPSFPRVESSGVMQTE